MTFQTHLASSHVNFWFPWCRSHPFVSYWYLCSVFHQWTSNAVSSLVSISQLSWREAVSNSAWLSLNGSWFPSPIISLTFLAWFPGCFSSPGTSSLFHDLFFSSLVPIALLLAAAWFGSIYLTSTVLTSFWSLPFSLLSCSLKNPLFFWRRLKICS